MNVHRLVTVLAYDLDVPPSMLTAAIPLSLLSLIVAGLFVVGVTLWAQ